jgi:predicted nucleic acid-binding protein
VRPEQVPSGPLLVDTDVVSLLALEEDRADEFASLVQGHELFVCFVTVAEIETFLRLGALKADKVAAVRDALGGYSRFEVVMDDVIERWAEIRSATRTTMSRKDRERRQNDTWLVACAASVADPPPLVTADLSDMRRLTEAAGLSLVHPDA